MNRSAVLFLFLLIVATPGLAYWSQQSLSSGFDFELTARVAEEGGWSQENLTATVGDEISIRMSSADVVHGFAIGRVDLPPVDVNPGEWSAFAWTPEEPGEYTFYCTRWCGPNHWRMTGTIQVVDPAGTFPSPTPAPAPRYLIHGIDIDDREIRPELRHLRPSPARGTALGVEPSRPWTDPIDPDLTTPFEAFERLRSDPATQSLSRAQTWDLIASLWTQRLDRRAIAQGDLLYQANCAACHGTSGAGDGVMARHFLDPPVMDFSDLSRMATANTILLEAKVLRGGMGSGMPYWGSIMTSSDMEALVEYLWTLTFTPE
jgi:mono/diheme cytochrome c family protein